MTRFEKKSFSFSFIFNNYSLLDQRALLYSIQIRCSKLAACTGLERGCPSIIRGVCPGITGTGPSSESCPRYSRRGAQVSQGGVSTLSGTLTYMCLC
jgi:hypothetical protein